MPQALKLLSLIHNGSWENSPFPLLVLWGNKKLRTGLLMQVTKWYRDDWWNAANIVASDYVLGNNLVEESIRANRKRKKCRSIIWFGL